MNSLGGIQFTYRYETGMSRQFGSTAKLRVGSTANPAPSRAPGSPARRPAVSDHHQPTCLAISRNRHGPPPKCNICSFKQKPPLQKAAVFHYHFSSREVRRWALGDGSKNKAYFCPTCVYKTEQNPTGTRGKFHALPATLDICLSSSTLHEFFMTAKNYPGDDQHVDWLTAPGATIQLLHHMWETEYGEERRPMNLLVVAGLNNIIKGETMSEVMEHLQNLNSAVKQQSLKYHTTVKSTVRVATLLLAPQLCWLEGDGEPPHEFYINRLEELTELNKRITKFNNDNFQCQLELYQEKNGGIAGARDKAPLFHTYGVRCERKKRKGRFYNKHSHRWSWWREDEMSQMLHLKDEHRLTMGRAVVNYFRDMWRPYDFVAHSSLPSQAAPSTSPPSPPASASLGPATPPPVNSQANPPPTVPAPGLVPTATTPGTSASSTSTTAGMAERQKMRELKIEVEKSKAKRALNNIRKKKVAKKQDIDEGILDSSD